MHLFPQSTHCTHADRAFPLEARIAADRIRSWLLSPQVQLRDGAHAGAVVGSMDSSGRARYVYPEIAGYYLHWLAEVPNEARREELSIAASQAADWATRQFEGTNLPQTRAYLCAGENDWRNDALFLFDLAMLLRGLCAAAEARLVVLPRDLILRLVRELDRFVDADDEVRAARTLRSDVVLPRRWSTIGGPFEVKACSRILLAARHVELPAPLATACERLVERHATNTATLALDMLHPTLYFAEGMLVARPHLDGQVAQLLSRLLGLQRSDGGLPEAEHGSDLPRSDIIAQALRVGLLLRDHGIEPAPDDHALGMLAEALLGRVGADGSVCFRNDLATRESNVWCSMFAEQALRWYAQWRRGERLPAAEWLV